MGGEDDRIARELARMEKAAGAGVARDVALGVAQNHETTKTFSSYYNNNQNNNNYRAPPPPPPAAEGPGSHAPVAYVPPTAAKKEEEQEIVWERRSEDEDFEAEDSEERREREEREAAAEEERLRLEAQAELDRRQELVKQTTYDPSNPFGQWEEVVEEAVVEEEELEPEPEQGKWKKTRKELKEEDEEEFEEDPEADFEVVKVGATTRVFNEVVDEEDIPTEVAFKPKAKKERNSRKKAKIRDINA
jgi:hypothetical protein